MRSLVTLPLTASLLCGAMPLFADEAIKEAVEYRQGAMSVIGWNFKPMGAMIKGEKPYDQAAFAAMANDLAAAASLNLLAGYPEDSESDDSKVRPEVWMNWDDFKTKMSDFKQATSKLAKVAAGDDLGAIKKQFGNTAETCKACHKEYKAKKK